MVQVNYPSPAFDAGIHVGDRILAVNGAPMEQMPRHQLTEILQLKADSELKIEVSRLSERLVFRIKPVTADEAQAKIGRTITKYGPVPAHCPVS